MIPVIPGMGTVVDDQTGDRHITVNHGTGRVGIEAQHDHAPIPGLLTATVGMALTPDAARELGHNLIARADDIDRRRQGTDEASQA